jgi:hypothetical protein
MDASAAACDDQPHAEAAQTLRNRKANATFTARATDKRYLITPVRNHCILLLSVQG